MPRFRDLPLPRRLTLVMVLVTGTMLVAGTLLVTGYQALTLRDHAVRDEAARAEMIGVSVLAAIDFADARTATETLATLQSRPEVLAAAIYLPDGRVFAEYARPELGRVVFPPRRPESSRIADGRLELFHTIRDASGEAGTVYLRRDLRPLYRQLQAAGGIVATIVVLLLLVAFWLSARLQRVVTEPILRLAAAAHAVTRRRDYGVRVAPAGEDEIGRLTDAFNEMLDAVQARDSAIAASEERFRQLVEHASDGIVLVDDEGRCLEMNSHGARMLGGEPREFAGLEFARLVDPAHHAALEAARARVQAGDTVLCEWRFTGVDGRAFTGELSARRLPDGRLLGILRDVTVRRKLEQDLAQAQKLEVLGRLAGGVAHDFNNVLTAIMGFAELSRTGGPESADYARQISAAAQRGAALTRQLLGYARRQVAQPVVMDLGEGVEQVRELLHRLLGEDLELVHEHAPGTWPVCMDPTQLEQVLINLAVNARDAMPRGGRLRISARNVLVPSAGAPPALAAGEYVLLEVSDSGPGIPPEVLPHVFEPFFTTKGVGKGTGLGLANCYGIVKQSGGEIVAESAPGAGATFRIYLPRAEGEVEPSFVESAAAVPAGARPGYGTLLVVEDDEPIRRLAVQALRAAGYRVLEAADGELALQVARAHSNGIDMLITDVVMPRLSGTELAARLRAERPGVRVLYTSGYAAEFVARHGVHEAGAELLAKPYTPAALLERVQAQIGTLPARA